MNVDHESLIFKFPMYTREYLAMFRKKPTIELHVYCAFDAKHNLFVPSMYVARKYKIVPEIMFFD